MSRTIKFRAWDTKFEKMYYSHGDSDESHRVNLHWGKWEVDTMFPSGDDAGTIPCDGKHAILMQFTGLHDRNGKEIYEGDIVKSDVGFGEFHAEVKTAEVFKGGWYPFCQGAIPTKNEIIGNIYEHPELLK